jgi:hypothetical protein
MSFCSVNGPAIKTGALSRSNIHMHAQGWSPGEMRERKKERKKERDLSAVGGGYRG